MKKVVETDKYIITFTYPDYLAEIIEKYPWNIGHFSRVEWVRKEI